MLVDEDGATVWTTKRIDDVWDFAKKEWENGDAVLVHLL